MLKDNWKRGKMKKEKNKVKKTDGLGGWKIS
jgi:hypothetical protein